MKQLDLHWIIIFLIDVGLINNIIFINAVSNNNNNNKTPSSLLSSSSSVGGAINNINHYNNNNNNNFNLTKTTKLKTSFVERPRTIQRLVGGHLHHQSAYRNSTDNNTHLSRLSKIYFRRKTSETTALPPLSSSSSSTLSSPLILRPIDTTPTSKTVAIHQETSLPSNINSKITRNLFDRNNLDDAELLTEDEDYDYDERNWNIGFLRSSAGAGKETLRTTTPITPSNSRLSSSKKKESQKTLDDQVAEGRYALLTKEIFAKEPKRPGIISYLPNPEVPNDTADNYGGLDPDDIWLAEDHLLVLKGGSLDKLNKNEPWKPIDDYEAPLRQVQLPDNPKVPPPFLVQLDDNGPLQFIGNNQVPLINPFTNESLLLFPEGGYPKAEIYRGDKTNVFTGTGTFSNVTTNNGYQYPPPRPQSQSSLSSPFNNNETFVNPYLPPYNIGDNYNNGGDGNNGPPPFGFGPPPPFGFGPPFGSLDNITDYIDEDDPSFFYPPPYSFVYKHNYTNLVEPGPLVPGIILPPPPNFFSRLNDKTKIVTTTSRITTAKTTTPPPTTTTTTTKTTSTLGTLRPYKQMLRPIYKPTVTTTPTTTTPSPTRKQILYKVYSRPLTTTTATTLKPFNANIIYDNDVTSQQPAQIHRRPKPTIKSTLPPLRSSFISSTTPRPVSRPQSPPQPIRTVTTLTKIYPEEFHELISFVPKDAIPTNDQNNNYYDNNNKNNININYNNNINYINNDSDNNKGNPIYFEYFDARNGQNSQNNLNTPAPTSSITLTPIVSTVPTKIPPKPIFKQIIRNQFLRPKQQPVQQQQQLTIPQQQAPEQQQQQQQQRQRPQPYNSYLPSKPFDYDKYLYITPKPEIIPNGISNSVHQLTTLSPTLSQQQQQQQQQPPQQQLHTFNKEINDIRQTLQYYKSTTDQSSTASPENHENYPIFVQQQQQQQHRLPKAKAVYEYSFNAAIDNSNNKEQFASPIQYDSTPFKPMVQYSLPLNNNDGFQGISYSTSTTTQLPSSLLLYSSSTTEPPTHQPSISSSTIRTSTDPLQQNYYINTPGINSNRINGARYYVTKAPTLINRPVNNPQYYNNNNNRKPTNQYNTNNKKSQYISNSTPKSTISIEKQLLTEVNPNAINIQQRQQQQQQQRQRVPISIQRNNNNNNYSKNNNNNNNNVQNPNPINYYNSYAQEQQNAYLKEIDIIRQQLNQYPKQQQYNLENDTYINNNYNKQSSSVTINPNSEFINSNNNYHLDSHQPILNYPSQQFPSPNPNNININDNNNQFFPNDEQLNTSPEIGSSLHDDISVNYKYPLPAINPDSEFISPQLFNRLSHNNNNYRRPYPFLQNPIQYKLPGDDEAGVYFFTPQELNNRYRKK